MMHELDGYDHHEYMKSFVSHAIVPVSTGSSEPLPQKAGYLAASIARMRVYIIRLSKLLPGESD
jgi:hypothetical protein